MSVPLKKPNEFAQWTSWTSSKWAKLARPDRCHHHGLGLGQTPGASLGEKVKVTQSSKNERKRRKLWKDFGKKTRFQRGFLWALWNAMCDKLVQKMFSLERYVSYVAAVCDKLWQDTAWAALSLSSDLGRKKTTSPGIHLVTLNASCGHPVIQHCLLPRFHQLKASDGSRLGMDKVLTSAPFGSWRKFNKSPSQSISRSPKQTDSCWHLARRRWLTWRDFALGWLF